MMTGARTTEYRRMSKASRLVRPRHERQSSRWATKILSLRKVHFREVDLRSVIGEIAVKMTAKVDLLTLMTIHLPFVVCRHVWTTLNRRHVAAVWDIAGLRRLRQSLPSLESRHRLRASGVLWKNVQTVDELEAEVIRGLFHPRHREGHITAAEVRESVFRWKSSGLNSFKGNGVKRRTDRLMNERTFML